MYAECMQILHLICLVSGLSFLVILSLRFTSYNKSLNNQSPETRNETTRDQKRDTGKGKIYSYFLKTLWLIALSHPVTNSIDIHSRTY